MNIHVTKKKRRKKNSGECRAGNEKFESLKKNNNNDDDNTKEKNTEIQIGQVDRLTATFRNTNNKLRILSFVI